MTHPLIDGLAASPDILIHQFDIVGDRALIIRLSTEQLRQASFLDERVLVKGVEGGWAPWRDVESSARRAAAANVNFIFHIGHCGSTLVSRLLEDASGARALREPLAIRQLASVAADFDDGLSPWTDATLNDRFDLYLRSSSKGAKTILKATSWCGGLARLSKGPALFCYSEPGAYVATMLGGANNPTDLKLNAAIRLRRLRRLCGDPQFANLAALSPGELAAMSWATETATIAEAQAATPERFHAIEFDAFLARPEEGLGGAIAHLSLSAPSERIAAALSGPIMRTYSKDASFDYTPQDRRELLNDYKRAHGEEIRRARAWLDAAGNAHPAVAAALSRFA
ncbi:MAG: hypothetical protein A3E78_03655 [Alphaproteobacteria bacterium RIFCSPHIGHO2_12_FULL_63_12]|nr:MAG: hypothetical protein A3E78_03655 [Alphaproteobacteria bacterium RIFCSPHIGHO2_12_FULL_63_12]